MTGALSLEGRALSDLGRQLAAQRGKAEHLAERLEACERVLRELEWDEAGLCPSCYEHETDGHAEDCALHTALQDGDDDDPTPPAGPRRTVAPHACSVCRRDDCTEVHACE